MSKERGGELLNITVYIPEEKKEEKNQFRIAVTTVTPQTNFGEEERGNPQGEERLAQSTKLYYRK